MTTSDYLTKSLNGCFAKSPHLESFQVFVLANFKHNSFRFADEIDYCGHNVRHYSPNRCSAKNEHVVRWYLLIPCYYPLLQLRWYVVLYNMQLLCCILYFTSSGFSNSPFFIVHEGIKRPRKEAISALRKGFCSLNKKICNDS